MLLGRSTVVVNIILTATQFLFIVFALRCCNCVPTPAYVHNDVSCYWRKIGFKRKEPVSFVLSSSYLTRISWFVMVLGVASPFAAVHYNAMSWFDWTAATVMTFTGKAVVRSPHTCTTRAPVIFGLHVVVTAW